MQLAAQLEQFSRNYAINIHFTGCPKSCAQHHPSDIALLGTTVEQAGILTEAYHIYIGSSEKPFGRLLYQNIVATEIPALIQQILSSYQINRAAPTELFSEFVNRHDLEELVKQVENICQEQL
jgi:ferredoxin-nitrite reductase